VCTSSDEYIHEYTSELTPLAGMRKLNLGIRLRVTLDSVPYLTTAFLALAEYFPNLEELVLDEAFQDADHEEFWALFAQLRRLQVGEVLYIDAEQVSD
jgi:hypothetical protein